MSLLGNFKRTLFGKPIHTKHAHHERLPKIFGLPVFASDALSSVAYASEEILHVLVLAGAAGLAFLFPVSLWLGVLMLIVGFSYYQTIHAYPQGGGTYLVSTENLGSLAGRTAGASLLIDYVLTVAVSVSSGVAAIVSMVPQAQPYGVAIGVGAVTILTIANLRGAKESGVAFAIPTYSFVVCVLVTIIAGIVQSMSHPAATPVVHPHNNQPFQDLTVLLFLRAFAASCTALTGTEAIADGVQAFRPPEAKNASQTLVMMVAILLAMFLGVSWVAQHEGIVPMEPNAAGYKTVLAQICVNVFGQGWFYNVLLSSTALILFLAANTAYADFPRLSSFIAKDGYLPRQLMSLGDRLVFQNGVVILAISAIALIVGFHADTHSLIPLYAMGVFISFTLSQAGMTSKWIRHAGSFGAASLNWKMWVNLIGTVTTLVVTGILLVTKWTEGAWIIVIALAVMLFIFGRIRSHYDYLAKELSVQPADQVEELRTTALLLVPRLHKGILHAIGYAKTLATDVRALHVTIDPSRVQTIKDDWVRFGADIPLVILESPYRSLVEPVIEYIDETIAEDPDTMITVIVPQAVPKRWYHSILHNNAAMPLKLALRSRKNVVITNVRYFLK